MPRKPPEMPEVLRSGPSVADLDRRKRARNAAPGLNQQAMRMGAIGTNVAFTVLGGALLGFGLDYLFGTKPWLLLTFALLGLVGGMFSLIAQTKRLLRDQADQLRGLPPLPDEDDEEGSRE